MMLLQTVPYNYDDLSDVAIALAGGGKTGWSVCTANLMSEFKKMNAAWELVQNPHHLPFKRDKIVAAIVDPTFYPWPRFVWGRVQCGYGFIEDNIEMRSFMLNAERYWDHICCGSSWMLEQLEDAGYRSCSVAIQGVDHVNAPDTTSHPPRDRFVIFSGGKFEFRKSQDIVIAALKSVMARYDDVHLVCSWGNTWLHNMDTMAQSSLIEYYGSSPDWHERIEATLVRNGLPLKRCEIVPLLDNDRMSGLYARCHLGVFPNRCEGGTNLVAMEAIACGLVSIVSYNSGHKDIIRHDDPLTLRSFREIDSYDARGTLKGHWEEPLVDELVDRIEHAYGNYCALQRDAIQKASDMKRFTWQGTAHKIGDALRAADERSLTLGISKWTVH